MVETDDIEWVRIEPTQLDVEYQEYSEELNRRQSEHRVGRAFDFPAGLPREERCRHLVALGVPKSLVEQV